MYLDIPDDRTVNLIDANSFTSFEIRSPTCDRVEVLRALGDNGRAADEPDHVFVAMSLVRQLAAQPDQAEWDRRFAAMVDFAKSHGWIDKSGEMIKAHIVTGDEED